MASTDCEILGNAFSVLDAVICCEHEAIECSDEGRVTHIKDLAGKLKGYELFLTHQLESFRLILET
jgi:hypothetical protein